MELLTKEDYRKMFDGCEEMMKHYYENSPEYKLLGKLQSFVQDVYDSEYFGEKQVSKK